MPHKPTISPGHEVISGAEWKSFTTTFILQVSDTFPNTSSATHINSVVPTGNSIPVFNPVLSTCLISIKPHSDSAIGGEKLTNAEHQVSGAPTVIAGLGQFVKVGGIQVRSKVVGSERTSLPTVLLTIWAGVEASASLLLERSSRAAGPCIVVAGRYRAAWTPIGVHAPTFARRGATLRQVSHREGGYRTDDGGNV